MKIIVVFGATGSQGGSVAEALLQSGKYKVRIVTRNPDSPKAQQFKSKGAEVAQGDLNNKESVVNALKNCYGCYLVTNWLEVGMDMEIQQGKNVADACKQENVYHLVFSTLPSVQKSLGFTVRHFDSKAIIDDYMDSIDLTRTRLVMCFYYQNFLNKCSRKSENEFVYEMPFEGSSIPMISIDDVGQIVTKIFLAGETYIGKSVAICGETSTVDNCLTILNKYLAPKVITDKQAKISDWREDKSPIKQDFANFCEYMTKRPHKWDEALTKKIYPYVSSFEYWVKTNKAKIETELNSKPIEK